MKCLVARRFLAVAAAFILSIGFLLLPLRADAVAYPMAYTIITTYMAASGYTVAGSGDASGLGTAIETLWAQYVNDTAGAWGIDRFSAGCRLLATGRFWIGPGALDNLAAFVNWLQTEKGATANETVTLYSSESLLLGFRRGGQDIVVVPLVISSSSFSGWMAGEADFIIRSDTPLGTYTYNFISPVPYTSQVDWTGVEVDYSDLGNNRHNVTLNAVLSDGSTIYIWAVSFSGIKPVVFAVRPSSDGTVYGITGAWYEASNDKFMIAANSGFFAASGVNLPFIGSASLAVTAGDVISPPVTEDDDQALVIGVPGVGSNSASGIWDDVVGRVDSDDLSGSDVATDVVDNSAAGDVSGEVGGVGAFEVPFLQDVFPFCLPWDVYHFFQAFNATPVAPHFEWRMQIPNLVDYTFVIDLSQFDSIAQLCRILEFAAFCVGLAILTRQWLRG